MDTKSVKVGGSHFFPQVSDYLLNQISVKNKSFAFSKECLDYQSKQKWPALVNAVTPVRLEPAAPRSRVKHSSTEPLRSPAYA